MRVDDSARGRDYQALTRHTLETAAWAVVAGSLVALLGFLAPGVSASAFLRPQARVAAILQTVGAHEIALAVDYRASAPSYDSSAIGLFVAARSGTPSMSTTTARATSHTYDPARDDFFRHPTSTLVDLRISMVSTAMPGASIGPRAPPICRFSGAEGEGAGLSEAFHYTGSQNVASIESKGLLPGSYATPDGELSPLQAQIDLALPPNRGLPGGLIRIDLAGLRQAGYEIPDVTQVGRSFNMPGGGYEMQFPYAIPPEFLKVIRP